MPSATGSNWEKYQKNFADDEVEEKKITPLTDEDIQVLKTYGAAPYGAELKKLEKEIKDKQQTINEKIGVKVRNRTSSQIHIRRLLTARRNQILDSPLHISGTSPPTDSACPKSNRYKSHAVQR